MTDRPTSNRDDASETDHASDPLDASPSHDYQAPTLYESSDLLSKYRTPSPEADTVTGTGTDVTGDIAAASETVASWTPTTTSSASEAPGDDFTISFDDHESGSGTDTLLTAAHDHGLTDASAIDLGTTTRVVTDTSVESDTPVEADDALETVDTEAPAPETPHPGDVTPDSPEWEPWDYADQRDGSRSAVAGDTGTRDSAGPGTGTRGTADGDTTFGDSTFGDTTFGDSTFGNSTFGNSTDDGSTDESTFEELGFEGTTTDSSPRRPIMKTPQFLMIGVVGVLLAAFAVNWLTWPIAIFVGFMAVRAFQGHWGQKWIGVVGVVMVATMVIFQIVHLAGPAISDGGSWKPVLTLEVNAKPTLSGTGDETVGVVLPDGAGSLAAIEVTSSADRIRIREQDSTGNDIGYNSLTMYDEGTQQFPINTRTSEDEVVAALDIETEGNWTITLLSIDDLTTFDDTFEGEGGEKLVVYSGNGGDAVFSFAPEEYVYLDLHVAGDPIWSNRFDGVTSATLPFRPGKTVIWVESYEPWSVTMQEPGPPDS